MGLIGNDNYRPGLEPPPVMKNTSWLSSNMAQLMVFLNGLILTVTAFATLSVFIQEMVSEGLNKASQDVEERVVRHFHDMQQSMDAISSIIVLSDDINDRQLLAAVRETELYSELFDQILWLRKTDSGNWNMYEFLDRPDVPGYEEALKRPGQGFIDYVVGLDAEAVAEDQSVIFNVPGAKLPNSIEEMSVRGRPFSIVQYVSKDEEKTDIVVGFSRVNLTLPQSWFETRNTFSSIQVTGGANAELIYDYNTGTTSGARYQDGRFNRVFNLSFAGEKIEVLVDLEMGNREAFLEKIPFLMLLFGITLTLIGTLYVRNNQKQSFKLASMNRELAHKNYELNHEVSERERLNQQIRKSERENRAVIDAVSDIIFETSTEGDILFVNQTWKKVTGFDVDRSIGRNLFDMLYQQDQEEQKQNFKELVKGHKNAYRAFTRLRTADGSFRSVELAISMLRQDESKEMRVVGTITDVEERRRAERALSEAEKKYRAIVENAAGGIYQVTPEGLFLSANPAMAGILGYASPEEMLRDVSDAKTQIYVDLTQREKILRETATLDGAKHVETQVRQKDGGVIWVSENVRGVKDEEGNLLYFEGSMEDITQRKKAELGLREAKIESDLSSRAKSEFLANMSHELRTPLNTVIGFSEIIKNEIFGPVGSKEYSEYANEIHESGTKLLKIINEILDVSRIEAGERQLNEGVIDISKVVETCIGLKSPKIENAKIKVQNLVSETTPRLIGETQAVKQMLMNLISNAIKFTPSGGYMTIDAEVDEAGQLRLSVTDTGVGLTDDEIEKALSPFGQVNAEFNKERSGAGLGLTLVMSLIKLHGGKFELFSQKGVGTTATLVFPAKRVSHSDYQEQLKNADIGEFGSQPDSDKVTEDS